MQRREFLYKSTLGLGMATIPGEIFLWNSSNGLGNKSKIDNIELFRYDINIPRYFSWGTWHNRQHVFMKITSGKHQGWSEIPVSKNNPDFDLSEWSKKLAPYKNVTIDKAFNTLRSYQVNRSEYSKKMMEFIEFGLLDLLGKIKQTPAIDLLKLKEKEPIPGLFCILDKDLDKVAKNAKASLSQNLSSHIKVKMYGDINLDMSILKTVREIAGKDAMIMSDANRGYKNWNTLDELKDILNKFYEEGLFAMEDPSELKMEEWIQLQKMVGLSLIPDYNMGPSWESINRIVPGMGRYYNIHPSRMGNIEHTIQLAHKIKSFPAGLMIGDDSLVGPACTIWQQIAIGSGAAWVEAIEKEEDSALFLQCVVDKATYRNEEGYFAMKPKPGFGLDMDEKKLKQIAFAHVLV